VASFPQPVSVSINSSSCKDGELMLGIGCLGMFSFLGLEDVNLHDIPLKSVTSLPKLPAFWRLLAICV
jgi:hypothetical protein